jgi:hypothetical protein
MDLHELHGLSTIGVIVLSMCLHICVYMRRRVADYFIADNSALRAVPNIVRRDRSG